MTRLFQTRLRQAALAATLALFGGSADAWVAYNRMTALADPDQAGVFEVLYYPRAWNIDYWCAAGDYVFRGLDLPPTTRIYLVRGPGPSRVHPGRKSAIFTMAPDAALAELGSQDQGYSLSITKAGYNLTAAHGRMKCRDSLRNLRGGLRF